MKRTQPLILFDGVLVTLNFSFASLRNVALKFNPSESLTAIKYNSEMANYVLWGKLKFGIFI